jgi:hypothetical protein
VRQLRCAYAVRQLRCAYVCAAITLLLTIFVLASKLAVCFAVVALEKSDFFSIAMISSPPKLDLCSDALPKASRVPNWSSQRNILYRKGIKALSGNGEFLRKGAGFVDWVKY